jgi:hypothetical protein
LCDLQLKTAQADNGIYTGTIHGAQVLIALYVDDMVIASVDKNALRYVKIHLSSIFTMKNLGELRYSIGIGVRCVEKEER